MNRQVAWSAIPFSAHLDTLECPDTSCQRNVDLVIADLGWSIEQIQRDYGLSDEQIIKMQGEVKKREEEQMAAQAKMFDSGNSLGG